MKIVRLIFILFPVFVLFVFSCTKIDAPYAIIKENNVKDTIFNWDTIPAIRRVLLEDYTGHKCVNCPEASIIATSLEETYAGKLIVLAVHSGVFSLPSATGDFTADYRTPAGSEWSNYFGVVSNPNGLVNRKDFNGSKVIGKDLWGDAVSGIINLPPTAQMLIINDYNANSGVLETRVLARFLNEMAGSYKISVCITEDSLISPQKNNNPAVGPTPVWYNYVFNDVLRATNGTWGEILTNDVDINLTYLEKVSFLVSSTWAAKHCSVLAFVYNDSTKEILQVERKQVIQP
jgi:hypothetical protein